MNEELMSSGIVEHCPEDAYHFTPRGHTDILVCDMVDKPSLVTSLITRWLENNWCDLAVFNLKLPMKKRFLEVQQCLTKLQEINGLTLQAKQLYHDREEVTVFASLVP